MTFNKFVRDDSLRNTWIYGRRIKVYIRRSNRLINDKIMSCLDLANVEVDENYRGIGIFTKFLDDFEFNAIQMKRVVYVESIPNLRLYNYLLRRGYKLTKLSNPLSPCVYKIVA